jgi:hypothetical protein
MNTLFAEQLVEALTPRARQELVGDPQLRTLPARAVA